MKPIYDHQIAPRMHAGLIALIQAIEAKDTIRRIDAHQTICDTGLTPSSAENIIRRASNKRAIKTSGKKHNGIDKRVLSPGALFDQALS